MLDERDPLELAADDLGAARPKIEAARGALTGLDLVDDSVREAMERLDRMAGELERIEGVVTGQVVGAYSSIS